MLGDAALISHLIDIWTFEEINLPFFHSACSGAGAGRAGHIEEYGAGIVYFPAHPWNSSQHKPKNCYGFFFVGASSETGHPG
ncbi:hypothetical protein CesoFtcFv8_010166 [Champsocephalus esox]|uniref:Uncharacterized protein n=1 Tax=Champsocephalus esox TaxID=159716 RepID=A0AAN8C4P1_9TELE|nr:hypothetical protein CesoFtcFv8_010166 [Champsocephalus esox]